ncbi:MAG: hypothetical protein IH985_03340 [Planctomycetes bacterium]|nr:hypothetical protein [Planctomycetota bacterium]
MATGEQEPVIDQPHGDRASKGWQTLWEDQDQKIARVDVDRRDHAVCTLYTSDIAAIVETIREKLETAGAGCAGLPRKVDQRWPGPYSLDLERIRVAGALALTLFTKSSSAVAHLFRSPGLPEGVTVRRHWFPSCPSSPREKRLDEALWAIALLPSTASRDSDGLRTAAWARRLRGLADDLGVWLKGREPTAAEAAVDPGAFDPVAKRAAETATRMFGGGDDTKPPALPAGAEAIDEHDAAILAFLNRIPNLRRKISDVLPAEGPQDRKAVAARLRKLADRTPPLVDYPKGARDGVAILTAGVEALKRATPPMPR